MKARRILMALVVIGAGAGLAAAQGIWAKKEWQKWSGDDCFSMLENSPWAQKWVRSEVKYRPLGQPSDATGREAAPEIFYIIQIRSALPLRQAVVRKMQLQEKYDKKSAEEKKSFDAAAAPYLSRKYDDVIVVHVVYGSNVQSYERQLMRFWQGYPQGTVPQEATLITSAGTRVLPVRFISPPGGAMEFELIFPRHVNGEPVIAPGVKSFTVEFRHPNIGEMETEQLNRQVSVENFPRVFKEFKTEKMTVNGEVLY